MTLSDVLKDSLSSVAKYIIGFVVFLAALLTVMDHFGFEIPLATIYSNLDTNAKILFILALTILICSVFFVITIYIVNRLVKEIDNKRPISKSKP